ncbi:terminase small subunit [Acinetobacter haemolyticus]|uniref:terminase small subunit n=1 Tax=Acinetobacter haemolyticus TaxID=29430 RepID=UPI00338F0125
MRAGYAVKDEDTAAVMSSRLLRNDKVQEAIAEAQAEREERTKIDADYVLKRLVEIDQMDVLDIMDENLNMKPLKEWPKIWRQYINNIESIELSDGEGWLKKIKWPDKVKNLELIGKHVSVGAFKDKVEHSGQLEIQSLSSLMDELSKED